MIRFRGSRFKLGTHRIDPDASEIDGTHIGTTAMDVLMCLDESLSVYAQMLRASVLRELTRTDLVVVEPELGTAPFELRGIVGPRTRSSVRVAFRLVRTADGRVLWCDDAMYRGRGKHLERAAFIARTVEHQARHQRLQRESNTTREHIRRGLLEWGRLALSDGGSAKAALRHFEHAIDEDPSSTMAHSMLAIMHAIRFGWRMRAARALPGAHKQEAQWQAGSLAIATTSFYACRALGNSEDAWVWLERAIANREYLLIGALKCSHSLADIRTDRRYPRVLQYLSAIEGLGSPTASVAAPR